MQAPWAPKPEWTGGGSPARVAIVQDAFWAGGAGPTPNAPNSTFYFNHADGFGRSEIGYGRFYAFKQSGNRSSCAGINIGYLDGHADWVKNLKTNNAAWPWLLDLPSSQTAMEFGGSMAESGVPLTVRGAIQGS